MVAQLRALVTPVQLDAPTPGSLAGRAMLSTVGVAVQGLVRFVYTFLVAHLLGAEAVADTNTVISLALLASLLWPSAAGSAASKFVALARGSGDVGTATRVAAYLGRWTAVTSAALAALAGTYTVVVLDRSLPAAGSAALLVVAYSGYGFVRGVQYGVGLVARAAAWDVISAALAIALLLGVLLGRLDDLLVVPLAVGYLVYAVTGWPRTGSGPLPRGTRRQVDGFVGLTVVGTLASTGVGQASLLVADRTDSAAEVGYYAAALALATPVTMVSRSLSLVLFPSMAEVHGRGDGRGLARQTDLATRALVAAMTLLFGAVVLLSGPLVALLYPAGFARAGQLLPLQVAAMLCVTVGVASVNRLTSASQRGAVVAVATSLAGAFVAVVLWAVTAPGGGVVAVAVGLVGWGVVSGLAPVLLVWRLDGHRWGWLALRWCLGVALLAAGWVVVQGRPWWVCVAATAVFAVLWLTASAPDLRRAVRPAARDRA